jgi:cell division protein FtsZ
VIHEVAHPEANIIFGTVIDDEMGDEVRVTVIAAGFERWDEKKGGDRAAGRSEERRGSRHRDEPVIDVFGDEGDDDGGDGDDDFDVPSFLR